MTYTWSHGRRLQAIETLSVYFLVRSPKQDPEIEGVVPYRIGILEGLNPIQGQGFQASAAPQDPNRSQEPPPTRGIHPDSCKGSTFSFRCEKLFRYDVNVASLFPLTLNISFQKETHSTV